MPESNARIEKTTSKLLILLDFQNLTVEYVAYGKGDSTVKFNPLAFPPTLFGFLTRFGANGPGRCGAGCISIPDRNIIGNRHGLHQREILEPVFLLR